VHADAFHVSSAANTVAQNGPGVVACPAVNAAPIVVWLRRIRRIVGIICRNNLLAGGPSRCAQEHGQRKQRGRYSEAHVSLLAQSLPVPDEWSRITLTSMGIDVKRKVKNRYSR